MKNILIVDKISLNIQTRYQAEQPNQSQYGGPWGDPSQTVHLEVPDNIDADCAVAIMENEEIVVSENLEKKAEKLEQARQAKLDKIRKLREPKLQRVDQLVNIAVLDAWTASEKTELKNYRNMLLNITNGLKDNNEALDALDVEAMLWPEEPSEN